jgi:hypothetical protein
LIKAGLFFYARNLMAQNIWLEMPLFIGGLRSNTGCIINQARGMDMDIRLRKIRLRSQGDDIIGPWYP